MSDIISEGLDAATGVLRRKKTRSGIIAPATTKDELWDLCYRVLNIKIPRKKICPTCVAPFDAFAAAYFAEDPISVWWASRGFGGKSFMLAALSLLEAISLSAKVNLLGGSGEQSQRVLRYMDGDEVPNVFWEAPRAPRELIRGGHEHGKLKAETVLTNNGYIRALMASQTSVRGPHPERLRLDEVDEMDLSIFDAALGQPMALRDVPSQTVASSTWHNSNGTMTEILSRASDRGWPVYRWCYRENMITEDNPDGWLSREEIERKKTTITQSMWANEYELQEPNPGLRAIDTQLVEMAFDEEYGVFQDVPGRPIIVEDPVPGAVYVHGVDWAKRQDFTCIVTLRMDDPPVRLVAFERVQKMPWPVIVGKYESRIEMYGGDAFGWRCHDETGIGDVIGDYLSVESEGVWMSGKLRAELLTSYINAVERLEIVFPRIDSMYDEHRLASVDDVYSTSKEHHLPDTIAAAALAWWAHLVMPVKRKVRLTWGN